MVTRTAFISHASQDADISQRVCNFLENKGISCWIAPRDVRPGHEFASEIMAGLGSCQVVVLILSENANNSIYVKREIERAVSSGKPVFPIRIREVNPSQTLEFFVASSQWIDAWKPPIEQYLEQLANAIQSATGMVQSTSEAGTTPSTPGRFAGGERSPATKSGKGGVPLALVLIAGIVLAAGGWFGYKHFSGPGAPDMAVMEHDGPSVQAVDEPAPQPVTHPVTRVASPKPAETVDAQNAIRDSQKISSPTSEQVQGAQSGEPEIGATSREILRELGNTGGNSRYKSIREYIRDKKLPGSMTVDEMLAIIDGSTYRTSLVDAMIRSTPQHFILEDALKILSGTAGNERYNTLKILKNAKRIPETLSVDQALEVIKGSTYRLNSLEMLLQSLPASLDFDEAMKIVSPVSGNNRFNTIKLLKNSKRLPANLTTDQAIALLEGTTYRLNVLGFLMPSLPTPLAYEDIMKIVSPVSGNNRYNTIKLLHNSKRVPENLTADEVLAILDGTTYRVNAFAYLASSLPVPLTFDDTLKIVSTVQGNNRYNTIRSLKQSNRIPSGLSDVQIDQIADGSTYRDKVVTMLKK